MHTWWRWAVGRGARRVDSGSAVVEFVLVGTLLTVLTLSVIQLALALYIRTTLLDAAAEGARHAALADNGLIDGVGRTQDLITTAVGARYATGVAAGYAERGGYLTVEVSVTAPLPLIGMLGFEHGLKVVGHAVVETLG
ncbi:MAG: TadE family protein [Leifsonia sp.]